jgi:hypothetical protein
VTPTASPAPPTPTFVIPTAPPTSTPSPAPSLTPTPNALFGIGPIIFRDAFDQNTGWAVGEDNLGGTSISDGRLVLSVRNPKTYRYAISPVSQLTDFYAEAVVRPLICNEDDEFGMMFHFDSDGNHFRLSLACNGSVRVVRVLHGQSFNMIPPTQTYEVIPGPLVENTIGVLAIGADFHLFINGVDVLRMRNAEIPLGTLGFFVHAESSGQTTVAFDDLTVRAVPPTPTPTSASLVQPTLVQSP